MSEYEAINNLLNPFIESSLGGLMYSPKPLKCKGMISFNCILKETKRERVTNKLIDQYAQYIRERGVEVTVNNETRTIYILIEDINNVVLTPAQMTMKNTSIAHYIANYAN